MGNFFKTAVLLAALTCLVVLIGGAIGGQQGMLIAFVLAAGMNFASYWFSDRIVLSMYRAQPVDEASAPDLYAMVRRLTTRAEIPMPRVYIIPGDTPNAFATGRNPEHAAVAVTEGIMRMLDDEELEGVLAHELSHVKNRDTLIMTIAATLAGVITYLAHMAQWAAIFGAPTERRRGLRWRWLHRGNGHGDRRPHRGDAGPDGDLADPGVPGRCERRATGGAPVGARQGAREARDGSEDGADARDAGHRTPVHRQPAARRRDHEPLFHASSDAGASRPPPRHEVVAGRRSGPICFVGALGSASHLDPSLATRLGRISSLR